MKWFINMKIRAKLLSCFIVLATLTGIVGVFGVTSMNNINHRSESMYNNNFLPVQDLKNVEIALQEVRANQILAVYEQDPTTFQTRLDTINKMVEQNNELLSNYEKTIQGDIEEKTLYTNVIDNLTTYRTILNNNLDLIKNKQYDESLATLGKVTEARLKLDEELQKLIEYNEMLASNAVQENADNFNQQTLIMISVIVIGIVLAIVLGLLIANMLSKQLNTLL